MIVSELQGGLGNQMFQYAAARSLATARGTEVALDLSWFAQSFDDKTTKRRYELDCFYLDQHTQRLSRSLSSRLSTLFAKNYHEPHFHYDPKFKSLPKSSHLHGYFQSEKYFKPNRQQLLEDFSWTIAATGKNKQLEEAIDSHPNSVSIHVRRGDYVQNSTVAQVHGQVSMAYYSAAVKQLLRHVKQPHFYIFSDDPNWTRDNLKFKHPVTYISHNSSGAEDLRLMQVCKHNIIANSSFSWWGAWLNTNPQKIVISPKTWFSESANDTRDLIPKDWQRI